jgi:GNAT superfamily N-acetyltransferase
VTVQIRPARHDELTAVGDLCVAAYVAGGHLSPSDPYATTLADAPARAASTTILVAVSDDRIVGTVTICPPESPYAEVCREGESEFRFLAVAPSAWRTGVGQALVAACEKRAVEQGQSAHVICVIDRNTGAHAFYENLGFHRFPERDWDPIPGVHLQALRRHVPWRA